MARKIKTDVRFKSKEEINKASAKIPLQRLGKVEDLDEIISKAAKDLDIPHILHVCLDYFVGITYNLAPDAENAELIIDKTIERAKNQYSHEKWI